MLQDELAGKVMRLGRQLEEAGQLQQFRRRREVRILSQLAGYLDTGI